jgi:hypothetical protein
VTGLSLTYFPGTYRPVNYVGTHQRLRDLRGPARECDCANCGGSAAKWSYSNAAPDEVAVHRGWHWSPDLAQYRPLCKRCHRTFDTPLHTAGRAAAHAARQAAREVARRKRVSTRAVSAAQQTTRKAARR